MFFPFVSVLSSALAAIRTRLRVSLVIAFSIGIGIGMAGATLGIARHLLWNRLPYESPQDLVHIAETHPVLTRPLTRVPTYEALRDNSESLEHACIVRPEAVTVTGIDVPRRTGGVRVCENFFDLLGSKPLLGRTFVAGDEQNQSGNVAIVSQGFWNTTLDADQSVLGRTLRIDGESTTIVGVMASTFRFPPSENAFSFDTVPMIEIWRPLGDPVADYPSLRSQLRNFNHTMIGRLDPNATVTRASAEFNQIISQIGKKYPRDYDGVTIQVVSLGEHLRRQFVTPTWLFISAVLAFCLIAALNASSLLMVQAFGRRQEFATKLALGGTRSLLFVQLISEMIAIVSGGCIVGFSLTSLLLSVLGNVAPPDLVLLQSVGVDFVVLLGSALFVILACVAMVALPYLKVLIKSGGNVLLAGRGRQDRIGGVATLKSLSIVLVFQLAFATVLLVGVGVLTRSFWETLKADPGFDSENVLTMYIGVSFQEFRGNVETTGTKFDQILNGIRSLPGVIDVGSVNMLPLDGRSNISTTTKFGGTRDDEMIAEYRWIRGAYLSTMRIPLIQGRDFTDSESDAEMRSALVSSSAAHVLWPSEDAIGKRFKRANADVSSRWYTVIGVVGDLRNDALNQEPRPQVYLKETHPRMSVVVRTEGESSGIVSAVRALVSRVDGTLAVSHVRTMSDIVGESLAPLRFCLVVAIVLAIVSVLLALFGVTSLVRYSVEQQRYSVGVKAAIGANPRLILFSFVRNIFSLLAIGLVMGLIIVRVSFGALGGLLYNVGAWDNLSVIVVAVLLAAGCFGSCWLAARRIAYCEPVLLLRL